jgi:hypothetical protein
MLCATAWPKRAMMVGKRSRRDVLQAADMRLLTPTRFRHFCGCGRGSRVVGAAASTGRWVIEIVERIELHKFVILPKRRSVERLFVWISGNRCLARDLERYAHTVAALVTRVDRHHAPTLALATSVLDTNFPDQF